MSSNLHWGILSTANINRMLLDPIKEASRSELAAVASRSLDKAQAYAKKNGIPKAYGSYDALLADPNIDAVYISLPNGYHCDWTVKAAEAGKHVLCEKPLVLTLEELNRVEAAAEANKVTVFEAFMYLHHPQMHQIQEIAHTKLGQLQSMRSEFAFYLPQEDVQNVRLQPAIGGGCLWDVGCYPNSLSIVTAQAGAPVEVWANQIVDDASGVDVAVQAQMRFNNGFTAQISTGFRTPFRVGAQIVGEKGFLNISRPWGRWWKQKNHVHLFSGDDEGELIDMETKNPYLAEVEAMEDCVLDGKPPVVTLEMSRNFLRSILAIYESARTGQVVNRA